MVDVLVLDDIEVVGDLIAEIVQDAGLTAWTVTCPHKAMALALQAPGFRILVTDIDLGVAELNGFEVARRVRHHRPDMPVVFISGRPWALSEQFCLPDDLLLSKPFRPIDLVDAIHLRLSSGSATV